ncbi:MAG: hemerythrin family protein [Magnetococcales bacterium]|nr:hemerythrin family protein [Magnetococcales bacterium]
MSHLTIDYGGAKLDFDQDLKLGISSIDQQHEKLFRLATGMLEQIQGGANQTEIEVSVLELEAFVSEHLGFEEALMRKNKNPNLNSHILAHRRFQKDSAILREKVFVSDHLKACQIAQKMFDVLIEWLCNHILVVDRKSRRYMASNPDEINSRAPRIRLEGRALIEFSGKKGITGLLHDAGEQGLFIDFPPPLAKMDKSS